MALTIMIISTTFMNPKDESMMAKMIPKMKKSFFLGLLLRSFPTNGLQIAEVPM